MNNCVEVPESAYAPPRQLQVKTPWGWTDANHTHSFTGIQAGPGKSGKQEGITPMRYDTTSNTAVASICVPSDEAKKIDYLNRRAEQICSNLQNSFYKMFNIYGDKTPRYYKDLIDAIKNGEYEIDEKEAKRMDEAWEMFQDEDSNEGFYFSPFHGINFTKFPKPDFAGKEKAYTELHDEVTRIKDIIAIMPAEEALKAVQEFQNWKPSNAPTVQ